MQVDRDEGVALFLDLADQFIDFFPVQQAATHADGVRTYVGGSAVERADIGADQPDLTADDADVGLLDAHPAGADGLDLPAFQLQPGLVAVFDEIIEESLFVVDNAH